MEDSSSSFSETLSSFVTFNKSSTFYRNWFAFFILGTINNLAYVVVNSSAQSLTDSFDSQKISNLIGLVPAANVTAGVFARSLNTSLYDKVTTKGRIGANAIVMFCALGLLGIAATPGSPVNHYSACLVFITILGGTSSFGERFFFSLFSFFFSFLFSFSLFPMLLLSSFPPFFPLLPLPPFLLFLLYSLTFSPLFLSLSFSSPQ